MFNLAELFKKKKLTKDSLNNNIALAQIDQVNIKKKSSNPSAVASTSENSITNLRNWYEDKYDRIIIQRNILLVLIIILIILSIVAIIAATIVTNLRKFDPFVIQIDENTGVAKVVNPIASEILEGNEALAKYFIKRYIIARETYNPVDFETSAQKTVRLYSTNSVYRSYLGYIRNKEINPITVYGQKNTTFLIVKSWSKLDAKKYIVRYSINETAEGLRVFNKISVIDFNYIPMELTEEERDINPVGFQVNGYRTDDDNS